MRAAALALLLAMPAAADTVTGTVTWRERMMLPPGAVLEVTVEDVSRADAPARVLGRAEIAPVPAPPVPFSVALDAPADPRARLSLRATVRLDGALLFTTDTVVPVLTGGAPATADLLLVRVAAPAAPTLTGIDWRLVSLAGVPVPGGARDPVLSFEAGPDGATFAASAGCNRFAGSARIEGDRLTFGPARATRMACPPPFDAAEAALTQALDRTARWEGDGATLRLLDAGGVVLLEAAAPN